MSADDILSAIAPELDSVDPTRRAIILDLADKQTSDDAFKESRDHYVALLAAHMLTLSNRPFSFQRHLCAQSVFQRP